MPVLAYQTNPLPPLKRRNIVNAAQRETMADVTARAFFKVHIPIVLGNRRLVHRRSEVRRVGQILGEGVVGQKAKPMRIAAADIHVSGVVPALRGILEQINGADRESFALHDSRSTARRQYRSRNKCERLERTPRAKRTRSRESVVDQMRSLQVETARADVADFERGVLPKASLHRAVPLLNVLRRCVGIERSETHGGWRQSARAKNGSAEIHTRVEERRWRREVIGLLCLRENVRNIMSLVAPGVQVYRCEKDSIGGVQHESLTGKIFGDSEARGKVVLIGIHQPSRITQFTADENRGDAVVENQVRVRVVLVVERAGVLVTEAEIQSRGGCHLPTIFRERRRPPSAQIHLRYAGLALLYGREAQQHAGQAGAGAIIETKLGRIAGGVLVEAAVLEESPHGPNVAVEFAAKFHGVAAALPRIRIADFNRRVPCVHGRGREGITDSRITLNGEPRGAPGVLASEADPLNTQRANDVVGSVIL